MRFRNDDYPIKKKQSGELTDTIAEEHPKHLSAVAEEQIRAMHRHSDGSQVELHEVGSGEFIAQSMQGSLEGKLTGNFESGSNSNDEKPWRESQQITNAAKIEYEKKSSQNQPQHDLLGKGQSKLYGAQQSVASAGTAHSQETMMMGCNCGAEWTVTGQSTKAAEGGPGGIKIEQYGPVAGGGAGYNVSGGGSGSGPSEYRAGPGAAGEYKG